MLAICEEVTQKVLNIFSTPETLFPLGAGVAGLACAGPVAGLFAAVLSKGAIYWCNGRKASMPPAAHLPAGPAEQRVATAVGALQGFAGSFESWLGENQKFFSPVGFSLVLQAYQGCCTRDQYGNYHLTNQKKFEVEMNELVRNCDITEGNRRRIFEKLGIQAGSSSSGDRFESWLKKAEGKGHFSPQIAEDILNISLTQDPQQFPLVIRNMASRNLITEGNLNHIFRVLGVIQFYDHTDPSTEWLGNFYEIPVAFGGRRFQNSEAAFQAQKFIHHPKIMGEFTSLSGDEAFRKAQDNSQLIRSDWMDVNVQVMREVLQAKIDQNPRIASLLVATGNGPLVEHNPVRGRDTYWSDNNDGTGQNMLGRLWMELRKERLGR